MPGAWLPGAEHIPAEGDGGGLIGGAPRVVWHATESDPKEIAAGCAAHRLVEEGRPTHLVWNPLTGDIVQTLPVTRAALGLRDAAEGLGPNREGRLCVQIGVVAFSSEPFTRGPLYGLDDILRWLRAWRVPLRWPAGPPPAEPIFRDTERDRAQWSQGGHFGHSQVPGNAHFDPGALDIARLAT